MILECFYLFLMHNFQQFHSRQQMAQGYAERLVPPNDGGLFGSFHTQNIWNNAFNPTALLRHTPQQDENSGGKNHSYLVKHMYI